MDDRESHMLVTEMLDRVLEVKPEEQVAAIHKLCGHNKDLRDELISLLNHQDQLEMNVPVMDSYSIVEVDSAVVGNDKLEIPGFELIEVIGQGSSSLVYRARQENPQRDVAIKVLRPLVYSPQAITRIRAEAHVLGRLEHQSIARIYEVGVIESSLHSQPYLVMEYIRGTPLCNFIRVKAPSFQDRMGLILDICDGISFAHQNGIIHRDIKPSNILVSEDESTDSLKIKVIDFGIAKIIHGDPIPVDVLTANQAIFGTIRYMSPERKDGRSSGGSSESDVYSLGILASEVLDIPCKPDRPSRHDDHANSSKNSSSSAVQSLNSRMVHVLSKMVHENPQLRYPSVELAAKALKDAARSFNDTSASDAKASIFRVPYLRSGHALILAIAFSLLIIPFIHRVGNKDGDHSRNSQPHQEPQAHAALGKRSSTPVYVLQSPGVIADALMPLEPSDQYDRIAFERALAARIELAVSYSNSGNHSESIRLITELESTAKQFSDLPSMRVRDLYTCFGYVLEKSGNPELAIEKLDQAVRFTTLDDLPSNRNAVNWTHIANCYQSCGMLDTAYSMYKVLLENDHFPELEWRVQCDIVTSYAGNLWLRGNLAEAAELLSGFLESKLSDPTKDDDIARASAHCSLGVILRSLDELELSAASLQIAVDLALMHFPPADSFVARMLTNYALTQLFLQNYQRAMNIAFHTQTIWVRTPEAHKYELAETRFILGSSLLATGKISESLDILYSASGITQSIGSNDSRRLGLNIDSAIGEALCRSGDLVNGRALLKSSAEQISKLYTTKNSWLRLSALRSELYALNE
tara:strand:- start:735985 stop:738414 length:2430 start_codon:yes stop_codon:yes gene_type:complete